MGTAYNVTSALDHLWGLSPWHLVQHVLVTGWYTGPGQWFITSFDFIFSPVLRTGKTGSLCIYDHYCVKQGYVWNSVNFLNLVLKFNTQSQVDDLVSTSHHWSHTLMPLPPSALISYKGASACPFHHKDLLQDSLRLG